MTLAPVTHRGFFFSSLISYVQSGLLILAAQCNLRAQCFLLVFFMILPWGMMGCDSLHNEVSLAVSCASEPRRAEASQASYSLDKTVCLEPALTYSFDQNTWYDACAEESIISLGSAGEAANKTLYLLLPLADNEPGSLKVSAGHSSIAQVLSFSHMGRRGVVELSCPLQVGDELFVESQGSSLHLVFAQ